MDWRDILGDRKTLLQIQLEWEYARAKPRQDALANAMKQYTMMQNQAFSVGLGMDAHPSYIEMRQRALAASQSVGYLGPGRTHANAAAFLSEEELRERKFKADAERELCEFLGIASIHDS